MLDGKTRDDVLKKATKNKKQKKTTAVDVEVKWRALMMVVTIIARIVSLFVAGVMIIGAMEGWPHYLCAFWKR